MTTVNFPELTPEQFDLLGWLAKEIRYKESKFSPEQRAELDKMIKWWDDQSEIIHEDVLMYLHRAHLLGYTTLGGRQALGKAWATLMSILESVTRVHGPLPVAGLPSGQFEEDD